MDRRRAEEQRLARELVEVHARRFSSMWGMAEPTVHDLPAEADALQAVELRIDSIGDGDVLEPHRHAYHELIWVQRRARAASDRRRAGGVRAAHDHADPEGAGAPVRAGGGRERPRRALRRRVAHRLAPLALLRRVVHARSRVPPDEAPRFEALLDLLRAEIERPPGPESAELRRHLLASVLLWAQRWREAQLEGRGASGTRRGAAPPASRSCSSATSPRATRRATTPPSWAPRPARCRALLTRLTGPLDEAADHGPGDPRGRTAAAIQRPLDQGDRRPAGLQRTSSPSQRPSSASAGRPRSTSGHVRLTFEVWPSV